MTLADDILNNIGKVLGGVQQLGIPIVSDVFGAFDNLIDNIHLKVDTVIAHLEDFPTTITDHVTPLLTGLSEDFQNTIIDPIVATFNDEVVTPISDMIGGSLTNWLLSVFKPLRNEALAGLVVWFNKLVSAAKNGGGELWQ